ncbi:MAG: Spy/CpxP family protein refolding chaperone [Candidatus Eremiobacteraeota bacterium]|nr:Spy/CpxP family protein refolding chaperone [Candidatus Eremiobacteraeota bacterium]
MSNLRLAAAGLILICGATSASLAQSTTTTTSTARAAHAHGAKRLLQGVNVSKSERAQLKSVRQSFAAQRRSLHASIAPAMREARAARQRGDVAAADAAMARTAGDRAKMKAMRAAETSQMRAALSPEQQRVFDANVAASGKHKGHRRRK